MMTLVVCLVMLLAVPIHADNVELTSNKERRFTCPGDQVIFTCRVFGSSLLEWRSSLTTMIASYVSTDTPLQTFIRGPFTATLIDVSGTGLSTNFTSTLQVTVSRMIMRNETTVMCLKSASDNKTDNFTMAGPPSPPHTLSYTVQQYGQDSVTLIVQWQPPQYDGGAPVNYTITVSPGVGTFTTSGTSIMVAAVSYNVTHTVRIVATNCIGNSSATMETIRIVNCSDPTLPMDGFIEAYHNTTEGAEIIFRCNPGFVPAGNMTAVCGADGRWNPDPATHVCTFDCGPPGVPQRGSLESNTSTTEDSEVFYSCNQGLVPEGRIRAVCTRNGWSPDPADLRCVANCSDPIAPGNGSIEQYQNTTERAEIFFSCNRMYIPVRRMRAVCTADGRWNPDPATTMCTFSPIDCGTPTQVSGVTREYNSTTVGSKVFYQCLQSGFTPSQPRSVCEENGRWNPDPTQVMCMMMTTVTAVPTATSTATGPTTVDSGSSGGLGGGAVAGIVIVLLLVIALCVAVVIILGFMWWRKRSDVSSKPPPQSDDVGMYSVVEGPEKPAPYTGYMDQGPGTEAEYTTVSDAPGAQSKAAEVHYDLPPGSNHPEGLVYASVDIKPKKPSVHHPKPVKQDDRVEYAAITFQPKDAAEKSQAAAATTPKTKRYENADEMVNLDNLLIQLRDVNPMWFELGDALDLPPSILDDIRGQFETNPQQCMIEVVDAWLQRHLSRGSPTWTEVAEALRKINQNCLADALESVYYTGELPIDVNMTEIPESVFQDGSGTPPPIPIRGTLTDDVEPAPPKPPKSWGTPEKKAPPQHPPRGGSGRRPPPRPPKPSAP